MKMKEYTIKNLPQLIFLISTIVWVISAIFVSLFDIFDGTLDNKWLSVSFLTSVAIGGFLKTREILHKRKKPTNQTSAKIGGCSKCGKNKKSKS